MRFRDQAATRLPHSSTAYGPETQSVHPREWNQQVACFAELVFVAKT
jgi:hypothetical protein